MAQKDNRQQMNTLLKYLAEQLYPQLTSLASGEPARPLQDVAKMSPGKVEGTDDPRLGMGALELVDLLSNAVPVKAMAAGGAVAAKGLGGPWARSAIRQAEKAAKDVAGSHSPLQGLPAGPFDVGGSPLVAGPVAHAREAAEKYMAARGLPYSPPKTYTPVNEDRAARVAKAFDEMKHAPDDPAVKASYDAMIDETVAQFQAMRDAGIKIEFIKPGMDDPYKASPRLAQQDVIKNKHLWVFPTDSGFGSGSESAAEAMKNNPLLRDTGIEVDGRKLLANDVFRIVHDYYGHIKEGHGFRAGGEENAWRAHSAMYSDTARPAMTTETRGQNSWVNYGPHGEKNRKASAADTIYADQKIGLLPDWVVNEGRLDPGATYLNVGMDIPGGGKLTEKEINAALKKAGVKVLDRKMHQSDTEMTSVLQLDRPLTKKEANAVSTQLKQESIAQYTENHGGELYGPKAAEWGPFNPEFFLTLDGRRMSDVNAARAGASAEAPPGMVRLYHGGNDYSGGERWMTTSKKYAETGYTTPGVREPRKGARYLQYVDVPADHPLVQKQEGGGTLSFIAPPELSAQLKPFYGAAPPQSAARATAAAETTADPLADLERAFAAPTPAQQGVIDAASAPAKAAPFPQYAKQYPPLAPPSLATDPKSGKQFLQKELSPEAEAFKKARADIVKDMKKNGYEPYYDPAKRFNVDPANYPVSTDTLSIVPKKQATIDNDLKTIGADETRKRLQDAYKRGGELGNANDWYAMGQLEADFVKELGPEKGRAAFRERFATPMATTTGGADPTSNFLMASYVNYLRENNLPFPKASHEMPFPIGGRYATNNMAQAQKMPDFASLGAANPKRHNFAGNFMGHSDRATMDEQMTEVMTPGKQMPPPGKYGLYERVLHEEAAKAGVPPMNFQDVTWAGAKNEPGKPMISHFNDSVERTHRLTGMPKDEIVRSFIRGQIPMYGVAGGVSLPGLLSSWDDQ